jgi:two-component system response regulator (stage 0 sporulation protein A)
MKMTQLEMTVAALRKCVPASDFDAAMAEIMEHNAAETVNDNDVEWTARDLLTEFGASEANVGHRYIMSAIMECYHDPRLLDRITAGLYPRIAQQHDTTPTRVERAIRHAVEIMWTRADFETLDHYFGNIVSADKGKPTNGEFIARTVTIVRRKIERG